jgi:Mn2+/Fe2+ NRAMP family transporter
MGMKEQQSQPRRRIRLLAALGPGILIAATGVGAGDIAAAGFAGSRLGYVVLWTALLGAFIKFIVNEGLTRWQLATGQTLLEGMVWRFGRPFHLFFGVYLLVWSFGVGASLISACGVALHSLLPVFDDPGRGKVVWGITQSVSAAGLVLFGSFKTFERLMTVLLGLMFASVVVAAAMFHHDWGAVARGLIVPRIPHEAGPDGVHWTLALMGGVGGTLTILCYGYWIRESGRNAPQDLRLCRFDLGFAYLGTALFGVAMVMLGTGMDLGRGGGEAMMLMIADKLAAILGRPFRYIFLLGAWGAVITSLLGVWQAVPYLFSDFWSLLKRYRAEPGAHGVPPPSAIDRRSAPYRIYLICLAFVPMLGLLRDFVVIQKAQAMLGAVVMPMLALALLVLNGNSARVGRYRNRPLTVLVLIAVLAFFAYAGYLTIKTGTSILS